MTRFFAGRRGHGSVNSYALRSYVDNVALRRIAKDTGVSGKAVFSNSSSGSAVLAEQQNRLTFLTLDQAKELSQRASATLASYILSNSMHTLTDN